MSRGLVEIASPCSSGCANSGSAGPWRSAQAPRKACCSGVTGRPAVKVEIRMSLTGRLDRFDVGLRHRALPTPSAYIETYILALFFINGFCRIKPDEVSRGRDPDIMHVHINVCL
jgi:hypothetical protein